MEDNLAQNSISRLIDSEQQSQPCKASDALQETMSVLGKHSAKFFNKEINHYDNQIRQKQKQIYEKLNAKVGSSIVSGVSDRNFSQNAKTPVASNILSDSQEITSKIDMKNYTR